MPDCTAQQAAYDLAVATTAVRLAEWAVEAAEAQLAWMLYQSAGSDMAAKQMALQQCLMGGMGGGMMRSSEPEDPIVTLQRRHIDNLKNEMSARRLKCDLLLAMNGTK